MANARGPARRHGHHRYFCRRATPLDAYQADHRDAPPTRGVRQPVHARDARAVTTETHGRRSKVSAVTPAQMLMACMLPAHKWTNARRDKRVGRQAAPPRHPLQRQAAPTRHPLRGCVATTTSAARQRRCGVRSDVPARSIASRPLSPQGGRRADLSRRGGHSITHFSRGPLWR